MRVNLLMWLLTKRLTFGEKPPPTPEIGWEFHSLQNFSQSSLMNPRNKWCNNQRWFRSCRFRRWHLSSRRKNARHWRTNRFPTSNHSRSIRVLNTEGPHMKLARLSPRSKIIKIDTSLFSPPRSPRTLEGTPCSSIASINMLRTVSAVLSVLACSPVIYLNIKVM